MKLNFDFVENYNDLSTNKGFQVEFICDLCKRGYASSFIPSKIGTASEILDTAGSVLGGIFKKAADVGRFVSSTQKDLSKTKLLNEAIKEAKNNFKECPYCKIWVCKNNCWSNSKGKCKKCANEIIPEKSQDSKDIEKYSYLSYKPNVDFQEPYKENHTTNSIKPPKCPHCKATLKGNSSFCLECGNSISNIKNKKKCKHCGGVLAPNAIFCLECGENV